MSATQIVSYSFYVNGDASGCNVFVYNSADCPGTATELPVEANIGKCQAASSATGGKSYKLGCPK